MVRMAPDAVRSPSANHFISAHLTVVQFNIWFILIHAGPTPTSSPERTVWLRKRRTRHT